jgi:hypothetical protein
MGPLFFLGVEVDFPWFLMHFLGVMGDGPGR